MRDDESELDRQTQDIILNLKINIDGFLARQFQKCEGFIDVAASPEIFELVLT